MNMLFGGGGGGGVSGNKQRFISTTILNRFWQNNTEKLPKRLNVFLNVLVLIRGFLL